MVVIDKIVAWVKEQFKQDPPLDIDEEFEKLCGNIIDYEEVKKAIKEEDENKKQMKEKEKWAYLNSLGVKKEDEIK